MRALVLLLLGVAACTTSDADATGDFTLTVVNGDNGCQFESWKSGDAVQATATITQNGSDVTAAVTGLGALLLEATLGGHVFTGKIDGGSLTLTLMGTRPYTMSGCSYTYNSEIDARIRGDILNGELDYHIATNNSPDCPLVNCLTVQTLTGARPQMVYNSLSDERALPGPSTPPTAR
jgi:hypothetical protein